jgi:hypothetical protein
LELEILQPLLCMCASMVQQYISDPMEFQITGDNPSIKKWITLTPEELIGTLDFDLVAANYASNRLVRQRNLLALFNLAAQSPFLNQFEALRELFKAFEVRNTAKLLHTPPEVQMMEMQQQKQQINMMMLESMMDVEGKARIAQSKPQMGKGPDGRPRKVQFEGKIPGAGLMSHIKDFAQSMGANALGLEGMGQTPGGEE